MGPPCCNLHMSAWQKNRHNVALAGLIGGVPTQTNTTAAGGSSVVPDRDRSSRGELSFLVPYEAPRAQHIMRLFAVCRLNTACGAASQLESCALCLLGLRVGTHACQMGPDAGQVMRTHPCA